MPENTTLPTDNTGANLGNESSLSNWAGDYVTDMLGKGWALSEMPYEAYTGVLNAPVSSLQDQAFQGIAGLSVPYGTTDAMNTAGDISGTATQMSYDPYMFSSTYDPIGYDPTFAPTNYNAGYTPPSAFDSGYELDTGMYDTNRWIDPGMAEAYMSPYIQQALTPQMDELRRQAEITRLNDANRLTQAGAYGGSRQAIMESELNDNTARLMNEVLGQGYMNAYNTGANIFGSDEDRLLRSAGMSEAAKQFGANTALEEQRLADMARQFASNQGLEAQRLSDMSRQFGSGQSLEAQRLSDMSRQFAANDRMNAAQQSEASRQFGANYGLDALKTGLDAALAQGELSTDQLQQALSLLQMQKSFGDSERAIMQEGIDKDIAQFNEEQMHPYKMVQFMQSLLDGMPLEAQQQFYQEPSYLSTLLGSSGGILDLINIITGGTGGTGGTGDNSNIISDIISGGFDWSSVG